MHTGQSNKIIYSAVVAACLLLIAGSVAAQDVKYNFMPGTDFSKFHTYKWVVVPNATYPNQIVDTQIKDAINSQLSAKGLTSTDSDKADLYVAYQTSVDQQKQWNAYGMGGGWRFGGGMASATSSTIDVGTLVVDMYDPSTKQLVWTGRATKTLNPAQTKRRIRRI